MVFIRPPFPPTIGIEYNRKSNEATLAAFSNCQIEIQDLIAAGHMVAMTCTWKGTHIGPLVTMGIPLPGQS